MTQSINEAASVKASELYKLSSSSAKAAYDKAITDGAIVAAKAKLNGAKIAVANFNSLTPDEVTAIVKAAPSGSLIGSSSVPLTLPTLAALTN